MATDIDNEIEAIRAILNSLEPLETAVRQSVLDYVCKRLGMRHDTHAQTPPTQLLTPTIPQQSVPAQPPASQHQHIKDFKEEKQPRSAIEMAAIVAYYLENLIQEDKRKQTVSSADLDTYFKIAEFKLPAKQQFTLINARNAGYFDAVGGGEYKLNAVGHNLVVHSMPRKGNAEGATSKRGKKKNSTKATPKKKKTR